jgi:ankyrin repeat protein
MSKSLPSRPNLEQLKNQAKDFFKCHQTADAKAFARIRENHPDYTNASENEIRAAKFALNDAQLVLAREYGFASWPKLKEHVESLLLDTADPHELFQRAFKTDDAVFLRKLLDRFPEMKAKVNEPVAAFDSPAIIHVRSPEMLDALLEAGADINGRSRWWAGGFGLLDSAEPGLAAYAIKRGAIVDAHAAARLGMMDKLKELITAAPNLVHARGGDGQTPLHFASTVEVAEYLLKHGADVNARDVDHESTPAQWMIRERQDVARYLAQRGCHTDILMAAALGDSDLVGKHLDADPNCIHMRVSDEYFPMINAKAGGTIYQWTLGWYVSSHDIARQFQHEDVYRLLMERSPSELKLIASCWSGDENAVQKLLASNPEIVAALSKTYQRHVALAARNNNLAAVRMMLAAGLPADSFGQHRATPLHWAAFHGNAEMAREILRHNPPLEMTDADFKSTPLGWAIHGSENGWHCETGNYGATVETLLDAGAKLPQKDGGTKPVREVLARFRSNGNG